MLNSNFTDAEKIAFFDKISERYYSKNFGTTSKSDLDLLMFHFLLKHNLLKNDNSDGYAITEREISDFKIAKMLGITPQRVKGLKLKSKLVYPINENELQDCFKWENNALYASKSAKYIKSQDKVTMHVADTWLLETIQDKVEEFDGNTEYNPSSKQLVFPLEDFIQFMAIVYKCEDAEKNVILENLRSYKNGKTKVEKLKDWLLDNGTSLASLVVDILAL